MRNKKAMMAKSKSKVSNRKPEKRDIGLLLKIMMMMGKVILVLNHRIWEFVKLIKFYEGRCCLRNLSLGKNKLVKYRVLYAGLWMAKMGKKDVKLSW
jgi:hypothetical protein